MRLNELTYENEKKILTKKTVTGCHLDLNKHRKVAFVAYIESHDDKTITNNINKRTHECIDL